MDPFAPGPAPHPADVTPHAPPYAVAFAAGVSALAAARGLPVAVIWRHLSAPLRAALWQIAELDREGLSPDEVATCERCRRAADDLDAALSR